MAECFKFFDIKSRIMTSFDTLPLDVNFGHHLTGSNFSDFSRGGRGGGGGGGRCAGLSRGERNVMSGILS